MKCYKQLLLLTILSFSGAFNSFAAEVAVNINSSNLSVGDTASVTIDLVNFPKTHGGGVNVFYNQKVVKVTGVQINPTWGFVNRSGIIDNNRGQIKEILFSDFNGLEGNIPVATIQLVAIGEGASNIVVTESDVNPFADGKGAIPVTINNRVSSITVQSNQQITENTETGTDTQSAADTTVGNETAGSAQDNAANTAGSDKINRQDSEVSREVATNTRDVNKQETTTTSAGNNLVFVNTAPMNSRTEQKTADMAETDALAVSAPAGQEMASSTSYHEPQSSAARPARQSPSGSPPGMRDINHGVQHEDGNSSSSYSYADNATAANVNINDQYRYDDEKEDVTNSSESYMPQENDTDIGLYVSVGLVMLLSMFALVAINRKS